jgi:hypothetical protein
VPERHPELVLIVFCRYVNQPEPALSGHSVTVKADVHRIQEMHREAKQTFTPELAGLMQVLHHSAELWGNSL